MPRFQHGDPVVYKMKYGLFTGTVIGYGRSIGKKEELYLVEGEDGTIAVAQETFVTSRFCTPTDTPNPNNNKDHLPLRPSKY